jgi:hypothetical protein
MLGFGGFELGGVCGSLRQGLQLNSQKGYRRDVVENTRPTRLIAEKYRLK